MRFAAYTFCLSLLRDAFALAGRCASRSRPATDDAFLAKSARLAENVIRALYRVLVCSNAHYMDDDEAYELGSFATIDAAILAARKVVDDYLTSALTAEITAEELLKSYKMFGEDPFIVGAGSESIGFSAWTYAAQRSTDLTKRPP